jgi:antitoxin (DNA-binding transcriptional repressor) of toxin-antitoxin stability system
MTEVSAREFNKDVGAAKRAAAQGPVIITDRGRPSHVLLSIADYRRLLVDERSIVDWLSVDDGVDLEPGRLDLQLEAPEL